MTDKLWCQMCGKTVGDERFVYLPNCPWCGAVLVEAPSKDGLLAQLAKAVLVIERRDTLIEKLIEVGDKFTLPTMGFSGLSGNMDGFKNVDAWRDLVAKWKDQK